MGKGKTIDQLKIGDTASVSKVVQPEDSEMFGKISGDWNPVHFNEDYAKETQFRGRIAHGLVSGSLFSGIFGTILPGEGTIYLSQSFKFVKPVRFGDTVTATVTLTELFPEKNRANFDTVVTNQNDEVVISGQAHILLPPRD